MDTNTLLRIYQTYSLEKISALRSVLTRGQSPCEVDVDKAFLMKK